MNEMNPIIEFLSHQRLAGLKLDRFGFWTNLLRVERN